MERMICRRKHKEKVVDCGRESGPEGTSIWSAAQLPSVVSMAHAGLLAAATFPAVRVSGRNLGGVSD